jgi:hypothetical protein
MTESHRTGQVSGDLRKAIRDGEDRVVDAVKRLVDTLQAVRSSIPAPDVTHAEEVVARVYDFTEELLESQRKFAEGLLEATKALRGGQEGPASGKASNM